VKKRQPKSACILINTLLAQAGEVARAHQGPHVRWIYAKSRSNQRRTHAQCALLKLD
jgi:hypothetical protein